MSIMNKTILDQIFGIFCLLMVGIISYFSAQSFMKMRQTEKLFPSPALKNIKKLSDYNPNLKDTRGDAAIYCFEGKESGGKVLLLGGTHPNEAAGYMTAFLMIENLNIEKGTIYILPRANNSAFTHNDPQEGHPRFFTIDGKNGPRKFRYGSRVTNPIDQWPDPEIYLHHPSGQKLAGNETRNLNRAYPGKENGNMTEKIAYAIINFINKESIDIAFDLHEAAPEYPVVNAIVASERSEEIASEATMELQFEELNYALEPSPKNFHGLSHREWTDFTKTFPILLETANPMQGRLRGKSTTALILTGQDKMYLKASELNVLKVPYDDNGISLELRVARHLAAVTKIIEVMSSNYPQKAVILTNLPLFNEIMENKLGVYF